MAIGRYETMVATDHNNAVLKTVSGHHNKGRPPCRASGATIVSNAVQVVNDSMD
jgi:hypothetical protein